MANLDWPPQETVSYEFRTDFALSIPLIGNKKLTVDKNKKEESGRDDH